MEAVQKVCEGLIAFIAAHGNKRGVESQAMGPHPNKYKTSICRDLNARGGCPRGTTCTFAHSSEELEK